MIKTVPIYWVPISPFFISSSIHSFSQSLTPSLAPSLPGPPSHPPTSHLALVHTHTHMVPRAERLCLSGPAGGRHLSNCRRQAEGVWAGGREGKLSRRGVYSRPLSHSSFILHSSFVPGVPPSAWQKILLFCRPGGRGLETRGAEHASVEGKEQGRQGAGE